MRKPCLGAFGGLPFEAFICTTDIGKHETVRMARDRTLAATAEALLNSGVQRLILESAGGPDNAGDRRVLQPLVRGRLDYHHLGKRDEPLLWVADGLAWAYGRREPAYRSPVEHLLRDVRTIPSGAATTTRKRKARPPTMAG